ncbi:hypothetical protein WN944_010720 [Citrus x changshan-huyou]|uniref:Uncharacterized protein n=1 Tax=Citrus x changshan-huyou TaxID=2935761 RepID=A0AAP0MS62_9ROSI
MQDHIPCSTLVVVCIPLTKTDSKTFDDVTLCRSTIGALQHATLTSPNMVSWCFKKKTVVSRSSTESEYRALATASSKIDRVRCRLIVSRCWGRVLLLPAALDGDGDEWRKEHVKNEGDGVRNA